MMLMNANVNTYIGSPHAVKEQIPEDLVSLEDSSTSIQFKQKFCLNVFSLSASQFMGWGWAGLGQDVVVFHAFGILEKITYLPIFTVSLLSPSCIHHHINSRPEFFRKRKVGREIGIGRKGRESGRSRPFSLAHSCKAIKMRREDWSVYSDFIKGAERCSFYPRLQSDNLNLTAKRSSM